MKNDNREYAQVTIRTAEAQIKDQIDDGIRRLRNLKRHLEGKGAHGDLLTSKALPDFSTLQHYTTQLVSSLTYLAAITNDPDKTASPLFFHEVKKINGEWAYLKAAGAPPQLNWYTVDGHRLIEDSPSDE